MTSAAASAEVRESVRYLMEAVRSQGRDDELLVSILRESADLLRKRQSLGGALSDAQVAYLIESGAFSENEFAQTERLVATGSLAQAERSTRLDAIAGTLSAAEVAQLLHLDASRVRHRQAKGALYAFLVGNKRRYPGWQFTGDEAQPVLPGLTHLVNALPVDLHPASIQGFMLTQQSDLRTRSVEGSSASLTPVEWLRNGGSPRVLVDILSGILQS